MYVLCSGSAVAGTGDALHPFASIGYSYDDNLFRLGDGNPGYDNTRGDRSMQAQAGLLFDKSYGRQNISLQAKVSRVSFDHFAALDYNGKDMLADWSWQLGNHFHGLIGSSYTQVLAPYVDIVTRERNLRLQRRNYANGAWTLHPEWNLRTGVTHERFSYDLASQAYNAHVDKGFELGVDYLAISGSTIGLQANRTLHEYEVLRRVGAQLVDADNRQDDIKLKVSWKASGVSNVQFLGGWSRRTHNFLSQRDASGFNARLAGSTQLSGKVDLDASIWRLFVGTDSNIVNYGLSTGANINAHWTLTSKIRAEARARYERRQFKGLLATVAPSAIEDATRNVSVGLTYMLAPSVQLSSSVFKESRNGIAASIFGNGSYHAKGVSFNVNLQY
jgi:exopolysaccharide biosynthesis operon protein EpsL